MPTPAATRATGTNMRDPAPVVLYWVASEHDDGSTNERKLMYSFEGEGDRVVQSSWVGHKFEVTQDGELVGKWEVDDNTTTVDITRQEPSVSADKAEL